MLYAWSRRIRGGGGGGGGGGGRRGGAETIRQWENMKETFFPIFYFLCAVAVVAVAVVADVGVVGNNNPLAARFIDG